MLTIAIDVDGVVADLINAWLDRYNADYNDTLKPKDITAWNIHQFVKPECGLKMYDYIEDPEIYNVVFPTSHYVLSTISKMGKDGNRIIYVTTSTLGASGAKFKWLRRWGFVDSMKNYVEASDKTLINADILIDDKPETVLEWYKLARFPILYKQPWNEKVDVPFLHTNDWEKIYKTVCVVKQ